METRVEKVEENEEEALREYIAKKENEDVDEQHVVQM